MALTTVVGCKCGQMYQVYIPKAVIFGQWRQDTSCDWEEIDQEEEADGEIELLQRAAEQMGHKFIDLRDQERIQCRGCGDWIDFWKMIRASVPSDSGDKLQGHDTPY